MSLLDRLRRSLGNERAVENARRSLDQRRSDAAAATALAASLRTRSGADAGVRPSRPRRAVRPTSAA